MKLSVFLEALQGKENVTLVIMDNETDTRIAEMIASSYTSLDDTIESRVVKRWLPRLSLSTYSIA